ncbi:MAG: hypothetical protein HYY16_07870 [Planctomycetes bacterium]|nr:hypothetical protein [Planctomycetota bacterium]
MSLASCPDCGREVSTQARHCVHCGRPWPASRFGVLGAVVVALLAVAVMAGILFMARQRCAARARCEEERALQQFKSQPMSVPAESPKRDY